MSVPTTLSFWPTTGTIRPSNSYFCITDRTNTLSFQKCENGDLNQKWVYEKVNATSENIKILSHKKKCWELSDNSIVLNNCTDSANPNSNQWFKITQIRQYFFLSYLISTLTDTSLLWQDDGLLGFEHNFQISLVSVNEITTRKTFLEPFKKAEIKLFGINESGFYRVCCSVRFSETPDKTFDDINFQKRNLHGTEIGQICTNSLDIDFGHCAFTPGYPGYYTVAFYEQNHENQTIITEKTFRNLYARREMRDLTTNEWDRYVKAVWTLKRFSTKNGREIHGKNCPTGDPSDFHTYDYFVMLHSALTLNSTCDQLHFSMMQEFAHQAWCTLFEKALQCVDSSVSMVWWNSVFDREVYDDMLDSEVWSDKFFGSKDNSRIDLKNEISDPFYVKTGAFAYFPLRKNRTGLCEELPNKNLENHCNEIIKPFEKDGPPWKTQAFQFEEPRPFNHFEYVSRRPFYIAGSEHANRIIKQATPTYHKIRLLLENIPSLASKINFITQDNFHGFAHWISSGIWNIPKIKFLKIIGRIPEKFHTNLAKYLWHYEGRLRFDSCGICNDTSCHCDKNRLDKCSDGDLKTPGDTLTSNFTNIDKISINSWWHNWLNFTRGNYPIHDDFKVFDLDCFQPRSGTFGRHPVANQDPFFYAHHAFTFAIVNLVLNYENIANGNNRDRSGPFYGLENISKFECPGHKLDDVTEFQNLVPYREGEEKGVQHTWRDIMRMWHFDVREYRYVFDEEHGFVAPGYEKMLKIMEKNYLPMK